MPSQSERQFPCPASSAAGRPCVWTAGHPGCHTWDYDKNAKRIAAATDVPVRIIERLIDAGAIDSKWEGS